MLLFLGRNDKKTSDNDTYFARVNDNWLLVTIIMNLFHMVHFITSNSHKINILWRTILLAVINLAYYNFGSVKFSNFEYPTILDPTSVIWEMTVCETWEPQQIHERKQYSNQKQCWPSGSKTSNVTWSLSTSKHNREWNEMDFQ